MPRSRRRGSSSAGPFLLVAFVIGCVLFWAFAFGAGTPKLLAYLIAVNAITFLAYGFDKAAAGQQWRRIPERLLHTLAIIGGSPAALMGQRAFRHKTIKRSFRQWFWVIVIVQAIAILAWAVLR